MPPAHGPAFGVGTCLGIRSSWLRITPGSATEGGDYPDRQRVRPSHAKTRTAARSSRPLCHRRPCARSRSPSLGLRSPQRRSHRDEYPRKSPPVRCEAPRPFGGHGHHQLPGSDPRFHGAPAESIGPRRAIEADCAGGRRRWDACRHRNHLRARHDQGIPETALEMRPATKAVLLTVCSRQGDTRGH
jgi:hypothetical protein